MSIEERGNIILELLGDGRKTREDLALALSTTDNIVRQTIGYLREKGYPICSSNQSKGYWIGTIQDRQRSISELRNKALNMLHKATVMENHLIDCTVKDGEFKGVCDGCERRNHCFRTQG